MGIPKRRLPQLRQGSKDKEQTPPKISVTQVETMDVEKATGSEGKEH